MTYAVGVYIGVMSAATATQPVNREEIRMLVLELGYERTAQQTGIKSATLRQWAKRFAWNPKHSQETVTTVTRPSQVLSDELANNERETRLGLSKYAKDAVGELNRRKHKLFVTKEAKEVAQTAAIVHRWDQKDQATGNVVVNVAILGISPDDVKAEVIDVAEAD